MIEQDVTRTYVDLYEKYLYINLYSAFLYGICYIVFS